MAIPILYIPILVCKVHYIVMNHVILCRNYCNGKKDDLVFFTGTGSTGDYEFITTFFKKSQKVKKCINYI